MPSEREDLPHGLGGGLQEALLSGRVLRGACRFIPRCNSEYGGHIMTIIIRFLIIIISSQWLSAMGQEPISGVETADSSQPSIHDDKIADRVSITIGNRVVEFSYITPGTFRMGSNSGYVKPGNILQESWHFLAESESGDEGPEHMVTISKGYYFARTKMTVGLYCDFLNSIDDPGRFIAMNKWSRIELKGDRYEPKEGYEENHMVNTIPWTGAVEFCKWVSASTGLRFRLPTEAEWEFAARGSERRHYPWGDEFVNDFNYYHGSNEDNVCVFDDAVGMNTANATPEGLFDMVGPVGEWCRDYYAREYEVGEVTDPTGPQTGEWRVVRSRHSYGADRCFGGEDITDVSAGIYGFRILLEAPLSTINESTGLEH